MEPKRNTETEGSSDRPVMTDEPNESGAKSVLPQATGTNKRVLHRSIICDSDASLASGAFFDSDASLASGAFFDTGAGSLPLLNIPPNVDRDSNLPNPSFAVPSASKRLKRAGQNTCILP